jgi:hypothetical protein
VYSVLNRYRASPQVLGNLRGLLTDEEISEFADLVEIGGRAERCWTSASNRLGAK